MKQMVKWLQACFVLASLSNRIDARPEGDLLQRQPVSYSSTPSACERGKGEAETREKKNTTVLAASVEDQRSESGRVLAAAALTGGPGAATPAAATTGEWCAAAGASS